MFVQLVKSLVTVFSIILLVSTGSMAQTHASDYEPYNRKLINSAVYGQNEWIIGMTYTISSTPDEDDAGNLKPGHNYGIGIGYHRRYFVNGMDDFPASLGIGARVDLYPNAYYKLSIPINLDIIILARSRVANFVFLPGIELNYTTSADYQTYHGYTVLYMAKVFGPRYEFIWGIWSGDMENVSNDTLFDNAFNVFRFNYRFYRK